MGSIYRTVAGQRAVTRWCVDQLDGWELAHRRERVSATEVDTHLVWAGGGPPRVLLLPGTNVNAATCEPLTTALAAHGSVVVADIPGQPGLSSARRPPRRAHSAWYGRWLAGLLEQITDTPIIVVGWSLGAAIVLPCSSPLIGARTLVSPGGVIRMRTPMPVLTAGARWMVGRRPRDSAGLLDVMHGPGFSPRPELVEWMTLVARHVRSSADPGRAAISDIGIPTRAISGERDVFLPSTRLRPALQQALGVELITVPGGGHLLAEETPEEIAALTRP